MQGKYVWVYVWTEMVVNTLHIPNLALALALHESQPHIISFWGVWFMQSAQN